MLITAKRLFDGLGDSIVDDPLVEVLDGKIVGAIGLSGGTSPQDGQCAKAGADTVK